MSKHRDLITLFRQSSKTTAKVGNNRKLSLAMNSFFANKDKVFLEKKIPLNRNQFKGTLYNVCDVYDYRLRSAFLSCFTSTFSMENDSKPVDV